MPTVLIVEDDELLRHMYQVVFEHEGFTVKVAGDGQSALVAVKQSLPDVILLDVVMPKVGGIEMLTKLSANRAWRHVPVVVTTSLTDTATAEAALAAGATKFIQKSDYRPEEVVKVVAATLTK